MADMQLSEEKPHELIEEFEKLEQEGIGIGRREELHGLLHHKTLRWIPPSLLGGGKWRVL